MTVQQRIQDLIRSHARIVASGLVLLLVLSALVVVRRGSHAEPMGPSVGGAASPAAALSSSSSGARASLPRDPSTTAASVRHGGSRNAVGEFGAPPGTFVKGRGTVPFGVHGDKITVVYYWKGDRTMSSPYLGATGQRGAVDEADAFRRFVAYVNAHADGGATFMGFPFNLHGRRIEPIVLDAGQYPETYAATAEKITKQIKPFAAVSSHGSLSAYICPALAKAHIFNPVTYDLNWGLQEQTKGWCLPQGLSWAKQVEMSVDYLAKQAKTTMYQAATGPEKRVYGLLYAEYPGLTDAVPRLVEALRAAGVPVKAVQSVSADLTTAGQQQGNVVAKFRSEGVNTIIDPDSGAPITFTHVAQGATYTPDYFVWPCSGQDAAGQVRLYDAAQWGRAQGLSCYDEHFNLDLTLDDNARRTQWFTQYQEIAGANQDPPSTSPLVYAGMLPVLVGLTNAGPDLTVERFFAGLSACSSYRYDAIRGATSDTSHMQVTVGSADGSQIGDAGKVTWSNTVTTAGNATAGAYVYSKQRYRPGDAL